MKNIFIFILLICILTSISGCDREPKEYDITVEDTSVTTGQYSMDAKLTIPKTKKKVPAVIMVHGSGPLDMDETIGKLKPFKDLAEGLGKKGIASIRYDKITYTHLDEIATNYDFTIYEEVVYDAISAFNLLKEDSRIDQHNIFVLGHSLGGQFAPMILNEEDYINGAIIMAGTPKHILDVLMDQIKAQSDSQYKSIYPIYRYVKNLEEVNENEKHLLYFGCYQKYWIDYNAIDIEAEIKTASDKHPLLIIQGSLDLQVPSSTLELYQEILENQTNVVYKKYDILNHCFVDGSGETYLNAYKTEKAIPKEVFDDIVSFINSEKK